MLSYMLNRYNVNFSFILYIIHSGGIKLHTQNRNLTFDYNYKVIHYFDILCTGYFADVDS